MQDEGFWLKEQLQEKPPLVQGGLQSIPGLRTGLETSPVSS